MKKDTLKLLRESDDLWRWAERNEPRGEEEQPERWWRRWFSRRTEENHRQTK